jgi:hypothetical protein
MKQKDLLWLLIAGADAADKPLKSIGLTDGIDTWRQQQQATVCSRLSARPAPVP